MYSVNILTTKPDEINEIMNIVCLYYAQLDSKHPRYKSSCTSEIKLVAEFYGKNYLNLKNRKDAFDALYENGRKGWHKEGDTIDRRPVCLATYNKYKDTPLAELEQIVNDIIKQILSLTPIFFSIRTKDAITVEKIKQKQSNIELSGINVLQEKLQVGQPVFIVLGGDNPPWETGLIGMSVISKAPYDIGYEGRNYRIMVDMKLILNKAIKRADLVSYKDTYDIIGIGPITKWEPNQALSQIDEHKAIALMRAMLEIDPSIETDLTNLVGNDIIGKIKGTTKRYIEVDVKYGEPAGASAYLEDTTAPNKSDIVSDLFSSYETSSTTPNACTTYTEEDFFSEVFMDKSKYNTIVQILERKKNIILQGAPGVGKTFIAKRLAYSILGCKEESLVKLVQFHQSYAYEDFVIGYKPTESGFTIEKGPFYNFCKEAEKSKEKHFFIIDEINRGNLSRIFGELLMLTEASKRTESATLLYTQEAFRVPENVYIIGMMNTADRSLAMMDYALRRRFSFFTMEPAFELKSFVEYIDGLSLPGVKTLVEKIIALNKEIENDSNLGRGFKIGHSYLCAKDLSKNDLLNIVQYEIIPLLEEYWYDEPSKVEKWSQELMATLN